MLLISTPDVQLAGVSGQKGYGATIAAQQHQTDPARHRMVTLRMMKRIQSSQVGYELQNF
ncbi:MAG TPA: hypothetical protein VN857_07280 [Chthoniobacterales bacterium]|nr:hypothetical protein [Chthoniobacterales bacterium]